MRGVSTRVFERAHEQSCGRYSTDFFRVTPCKFGGWLKVMKLVKGLITQLMNLTQELELLYCSQTGLQPLERFTDAPLERR